MRPSSLVRIALVALLMLGCEREEPRAPANRSPNAKPMFRRLQQRNLPAQLHASDGQGRAWLEEPQPGAALQVVSRHRFSIVFEAGEPGIRPGGAVYLQISPHWGWSFPQIDDPSAPGYTKVTTDAEGVELGLRDRGARLLEIGISGRALEPGARLRIVYGAGPARAHVDRFAERGSPLWIGVDGDGDGRWGLLPDPPRVDVVAGAPAQLVLLLPSTARPGESIPLRVALLDLGGNANVSFRGSIELLDAPEELEVPSRVDLQPEHSGHRTLRVTPRAPGIYRLRGAVEVDGERRLAESNPLVVRAEPTQVLWGDLHGHSQLSDGTGTPEEYFVYARDVAALDVAALTDHDRWGIRFLDGWPPGWKAIREAVDRFNAPGSFVALLGYEWTSWRDGHRHVLYFEDEGDILSVGNTATATPERLWRALEGQRALTFAHHSAGEPIATNWNYLPDPELEPITEITSLHGSSESADTPGRVRGALEGNFVRDVLDRGVRLGFIGSEDSHSGQPGLAHLTHTQGGLAGIVSTARTRAGVYEALRARRVYATNGPRIWLEASLDGHPMGATLPASPNSTLELSFEIAAESPLERVDLIRPGGVMTSLDPGGVRDWSWSGPVAGLGPGDYLYLRVIQEDGLAAWTSPFYSE
ncbi:MAG: CehA/McbA family metallohydrolase [Myxococcota bacterium]